MRSLPNAPAEAEPGFQAGWKKLNVTHLLEVSLRKSGNGIRITAQVVDQK
jgi:TolB-like protein